MEYMLLIGLVVLACVLLRWKGTRKNQGITFQQSKQLLLGEIANTSARFPDEKYKFGPIAVLFLKTSPGMAADFVNELSIFQERPLSQQEYEYLNIEILIWLYFWSDVVAFSNDQSQQSRWQLREIFEQFVMAHAYANDEHLEELIVSRLEKYMGSYSNPGTVMNPYTWLLNNLQLLVDEQTINRTQKLAISDAFAKLKDSTIVAAGGDSYCIFMKTIGHLFKTTNDISTLSSQEISTAICEGIQKATPADFSKRRITNEQLATSVR